jgi:hypothetical protein
MVEDMKRNKYSVILSLFFCGSITSCANQNKSFTGTEPDLDEFNRQLNTKVSSVDICRINGTFNTIGKVYLNFDGRKETKVAGNNDLLSIFSERYDYSTHFVDFFEKTPAHIDDTIVLDFSSSVGIFAFAKKNPSKGFLGSKIFSANNDFSCVNGVFTLKLKLSAGGGDGVSAYRQSYAELRLDADGNLLVFYRAAPGYRVDLGWRVYYPNIMDAYFIFEKSSIINE